MRICDKCREYNKCFPKYIDPCKEALLKVEVEIGGCPCYKELTLEEMSLGISNTDQF